MQVAHMAKVSSIEGFYPDSADTFTKPQTGPKECPCPSANVTAPSTSGRSSGRFVESKTNSREVALEVGINPNMLTRWVREAEAEGDKAFPGGGTPRDEEVARLKRELLRVTKQRRFFKRRGSVLREAVTERYAVIERCRSDYPVGMMCRCLTFQQAVSTLGQAENLARERRPMHERRIESGISTRTALA